MQVQWLESDEFSSSNTISKISEGTSDKKHKKSKFAARLHELLKNDENKNIIKLTDGGYDFFSIFNDYNNILTFHFPWPRWNACAWWK